MADVLPIVGTTQRQQLGNKNRSRGKLSQEMLLVVLEEFCKTAELRLNPRLVQIA